MSGEYKKKENKEQQKKAKIHFAVYKEETTGSFPRWLPVAVVLFTALLYTHSIFNSFVDWDDGTYIVNNPFIRDFSLHGVKEIFTCFYFGVYHPITQTAYLLLYTFFGLNATPYHVLSVALHLVNTWLVFKLTAQLSGKKITGLVVCVLFAIHPMHVEAVAWASALKDMLCGLFYLLALSYYLRYLDTGLRMKYYIITLISFLAALLSKSAAVPLSLLLFVLDIYKGRPINKKLLLEKIPFLLLSVIFGIVNIMGQNTVAAINDHMTGYGFINRVFLLTYAVAYYLINSVVPAWLSPMHYLPLMNGAYLPFIYYASFPFVLLVGWLATRRTFLRREILFGISFFLIAMSVMFQVVAVGSHHVAERYTYIPYIGLFYVIGQWISSTAIQKWHTGVVIGCSIATVLLSIQSWERIGIWQDSQALFDDWMSKNPGRFAYGYWTRGNAERDKGDIHAALLDYDTAIAADPTAGDAYFNRARTYDDLGKTQLAITDYTRSIELLPRADAYNNRGWDYDQSGNKRSAILDYGKAIELAPKFIRPYYNRAAINTAAGNIAAVIEDYSIVLRINGNDQDAHFSRGEAYLQSHDTASACTDWNKASELGSEKAKKMLRQYCK